MPRIVVVGAKAHGKSSLLENITKCPVFPRRGDDPCTAGPCTRCPVRVLMYPSDRGEESATVTHGGTTISISDWTSNPERVREEVARLAPPEGFSSEEVVVELRGPDLVRLELVDLPSFHSSLRRVNGPAEAAAGLVRSFLRIC